MTTKTYPRWPTTMPMTARHSQVVTPHDTEDSLHESLTCHKTIQTSSSHRCGYVVRWQKPSMRDMECVKRVGRYLVGKPRAKFWFRWQQSGDLEACSDADWGGDRATRRWVLSWSHHERRSLPSRCGTKKQQVVALSSVESELYAAVKTASEGLGIHSVAKDLGISCGLNLHMDASATMCLVNRRRLGKAKHVGHVKPLDTGGFPSQAGSTRRRLTRA